LIRLKPLWSLHTPSGTGWPGCGASPTAARPFDETEGQSKAFFPLSVVRVALDIRGDDLVCGVGDGDVYAAVSEVHAEELSRRRVQREAFGRAVWRRRDVCSFATLTRVRPLDGVRVDRLTSARAHEAGLLLAASHAHYPGFARLFPDPDVRQRILRTFMPAAARDSARYGHALIAHDNDGVLGVALWMPPGTFPLTGLRKMRMTPALTRAALVARRSMRPFARVGAALEAAHPSGASWYLQAMGIHPRAQRRGVGTRLMEPGLTLADEAGLPCYLQTSDPANVGYYQRFGFEVVQPAIEPFPAGPTYIGMNRPPARSTA
jgi:GNAT superfamily N-acetyltransferase